MSRQVLDGVPIRKPLPGRRDRRRGRRERPRRPPLPAALLVTLGHVEAIDRRATAWRGQTSTPRAPCRTHRRDGRGDRPGRGTTEDRGTPDCPHADAHGGGRVRRCTWPPNATGRRTPCGPTSATWCPCSTTPPGWAPTTPADLDLLIAAQLAGPAAHHRRRPNHAGPPRGGRPHLHRLGTRPACPTTTRASAWPAPSPTATCPPCSAPTRRTTSSKPPAPRADPDGAATARARPASSWNCCTRPASASPNCAASTSTTSTGRARVAARVREGRARSGPCRTACRPSGRSTRGCATAGPPLPTTAQRRRPAARRQGRPAAIRPWCAAIVSTPRPRRGPAAHQPARAAARGRHPPAGGRRRPAQRAGAAGARVAVEHADLHPRLDRPVTHGVPAGTSPGLRSGVLMVKPPEPLPGARLLFSLDPAVSHLNHGSFGAVPVPVQRAQQRLRDEMEANPVRFFAGGALDDRVTAARRHLATFVGARPGRLRRRPERHHRRRHRPRLGRPRPRRRDPHHRPPVRRRRHGDRTDLPAKPARSSARCRSASTPTDDDVVAAVQAGVTGRTRLVVLDQITSPTARVMPVAAVHAALRGTGIPLLVDAAHAPGVVSDPTPARVLGRQPAQVGLRPARHRPPVRGRALAGPGAVADRVLARGRGLPRQPGVHRRHRPHRVAGRPGRRLRAAHARASTRSAGTTPPWPPTARPPSEPPSAWPRRPARPGRRRPPADADRAAARRASATPPKARPCSAAASPTNSRPRSAINAWRGRGLPAALGQRLQPLRRVRTTGRPPPSVPEVAVAAPGDRAGLAERQQPDADETQEQQRIEVGVAAAQAPVQARRHGAAGVPGRQGTDLGSRCDRAPAVTETSTGSYVVRRPFAWSTLTTPRPATVPAKADRAGAGRAHRRTRLAGQVDAAVTGQPRLGRRVEPADHRGRPVERPAEAGSRRAPAPRDQRAAAAQPDGAGVAGTGGTGPTNAARSADESPDAARQPAPRTTNVRSRPRTRIHTSLGPASPAHNDESSTVDSQVGMWTTPVHTPACASRRTRCRATRSRAFPAPPR